MKKFLALLLAAVMTLALVACGGKDNGDANNDGKTTEKVAMITDYGDITDQSFNQTTYEACKAYCEANGVDFNYYKPSGDSTAERVAMIEKAVEEGYTVIVMPGYAFGGAIKEAQDTYPDVKFVALDVSEYDITSEFYKKDASGNATDELLSADKQPHVSKNVYSAVYKEELCGYMAGYAAVKMGYKSLGFLGGMAVPAVQRYGYGFVQGANAAAVELGTPIEINYTYGGQFFGDANITAKMEGWYTTGTEIVFACGGSMFQSIVAAASANDGYVIGVDVDQSGESEYVVTSAMKGLADAVQWAVAKVYDGTFDTIGGQQASLGVADNAVQLPTGADSWRFETFTVEEYESLYQQMVDGTLVVDDDYTVMDNAETATNWSNVNVNII